MLCLAGRTPLDEAAAVLFAQLSNAHGLGARVEPADAGAFGDQNRATGFHRCRESSACPTLTPAVPPTCDTRLARLRRKLPNVTIMLGCWAENLDKETLKNSGRRRRPTSQRRPCVKR